MPSTIRLPGPRLIGLRLRAGLEGIARNPGAAGKIQTPLIIGLAFVESLVLYALVVSFILVLKF